MGPRVLDCTSIATEIKAELKHELETLRTRGVVTGLAVILVGDDPASTIYVRNKVKACEDLGIRSTLLRPDPALETDDLLQLIHELNLREDIDGILVQLPLPPQIDTKRVLDAVSPAKDVDGFHPLNVGLMSVGQESLAPCTPSGIMEILRRSSIATEGAHAVVVGRSDIVGRPAATMLLLANATVTICHIHTVDLPRYTRQADILVVAVGKPGLITADMVKPGAVIIDVGINRISDAARVERFFPGDEARAATFAKRGSIVMGDVDPAAYPASSAYTPVPGGVGALTPVMLMYNTLKAARLRRGLR